MEWRLALFIALAILIVVGYGEIVRRVYGPAVPSRQEEATSEEHPPAKRSGPERILSEPSLVEPPEISAPVRGREVTIATPLYRAVLTTAGGRLEHFFLSRYRETVAADSSPLDLVDAGGPGGGPLGVQVLRRGSATDGGVLYHTQVTDLEVGPGETGEVVMTGVLASGEEIEKRFVFEGGSYAVGLEVSVEGEGAEEPEIGLSYTEPAHEGRPARAVVLVRDKVVHKDLTGAGLEAGELLDGEIRWAGYDEQYFVSVMLPQERPVVSVRAEPFEPLRGERADLLVGKIDAAVREELPGEAVGKVVSRRAAGGGGVKGARLYIGVRPAEVADARRYATALQGSLPRKLRGSRFTVELDARRVLLRREGDLAVVRLFTQLLERTGTAKFRLYLGPKEVDALSRVDPTLTKATGFGWFAFVAIPLLRLLDLSHRVTGNYGADIILLTLVIKILFAPLTHRSYSSMKKMQALQPHLKRIQEQFKDDRERLQKETMELYRRHRVNPLGGCLPMLLQFPVFIGLYQGLRYGIELRHAPFAGWIRDLSAPECHPWRGLEACNYVGVAGVAVPVLVLLMGASMLAQQWMTPQTTADPTQQRMMMLMPLVFTMFFINFPSGLVLYWLVNNVLTIGQQAIQNRLTR